MFKSSRSKPLRNLKISAPRLDDNPSIPPVPSLPYGDFATGSSPSSKGNTPRSASYHDSVILITKFDFKAEDKNELTLGVGEALKLLERKGNGWILVKPIGRISDPGLIPASYVRIVRLNKQSSNERLDEEWLSTRDGDELDQATQQGKSSTSVISTSSQGLMSPIETKRSLLKYSSSTSSILSEDEQHFSFQSAASSNTSRADSPNNSFSGIFPITALVKNASSHNGRFWYKVDITMNNGTKRYLCRYYQDFYKLHCSIVEKLRSSPDFDEVNNNPIVSSLPSFPDPIPRPDLQTLSSILLQRCQLLNVYIFKIVQNKHRLEYNKLVNDWIVPRLGDLEVPLEESMSNEQIEELLKPLPTVMKKVSRDLSNKSIDIHSSKEAAQDSSSSVKHGSSVAEESRHPVEGEISPTQLVPSQTLDQPIQFHAVKKREVPPQAEDIIMIPPLRQHRKPQSLKISISTTPPLASPTTEFQTYSRSNSVNDITTPVSSASSPSVWQSPVMHRHPQEWRSERSSSSPVIYEGEEKVYTGWLESPTEPLFSKRQSFTVRSRKASAPIQSTIHSNSIDFVKIKVFSYDDIFALKVKRSTSLNELKESILTRLECETNKTTLKLYWRNQITNNFMPLVDDSEISTLFDQTKIVIKAQIWASDP